MRAEREGGKSVVVTKSCCMRSNTRSVVASQLKKGCLPNLKVAVNQTTEEAGALSLFESATRLEKGTDRPMSYVGIYGAQQSSGPVCVERNTLYLNENDPDFSPDRSDDGVAEDISEDCVEPKTLSHQEQQEHESDDDHHAIAPTAVKLFDGTADPTLAIQSHVGLYKKSNVVVQNFSEDTIAIGTSMGEGETPIPAPTPKPSLIYHDNKKDTTDVTCNMMNEQEDDVLSEKENQERSMPLVTTVYTKNYAFQSVHKQQMAQGTEMQNSALSVPAATEAAAIVTSEAVMQRGVGQFEFQEERGQCIKFHPVSPEFYSNYKLKTRTKFESGTKADKAKAHVVDCQCAQCCKARRNRVKQYSVGYHAGIKLVSAVLEAGGCVFTPKDDWQIMWNPTHLKSYSFQMLSKWQKVNQFPRSIECTRKDTLSRNIQRMQTAHGKRHFDFLPSCFIFPSERDALYAEMMKNPDMVWICKPASSACGRGIFITTIFSDIQIGVDDTYVVEQYIHRPLLFNGFKFDLRLYVAVTSFNPLLVYLHDEGLVRLATVKYEENCGDLANNFVHLTNYSINKHSEGYKDPVDREDADNCDSTSSKLALVSFYRKLAKDGVNIDILWRNIEDLVIKTLLSIEMQVTTAVEMFVPHPNNCFELFGFDVLIDCDLRPWLLEVNFSPSLACDTDFDLGVKSAVLSDLFNMVGLRPRDNDDIASMKSSRGGLPYGKVAVKKKGPTVRRKKDQNGIARETKDGGGASSSRSAQSNSGFHAKVSLVEQKFGRKLTTEEMRVIRVMDDEVSQAGGFKRIFPAQNSCTMYRNFFESERPLNTLAMHTVLAECIIENSTKPVSEQVTEISSGNITSSWRHNRPNRARIDPEVQLKKEERRQMKMVNQDCRSQI